MDGGGWVGVLGGVVVRSRLDMCTGVDGWLGVWMTMVGWVYGCRWVVRWMDDGGCVGVYGWTGG